MKRYLQLYLRERPLFLSLIRACEAELFSKLPKFKKPVLDLGCGDGFFAKTAFGKLDVGVDVQESRMGEVEEGVYGKLVTYDGKKLPFKKESFGTVVSNCVLEHIPNIDQVLNETCRVLRPSGEFVTTVMAAPWEKNLFGSLLFGNSYRAWMKKKQVHFNLLTSDEWENKFKKAGFEVKQKIGYMSPAACLLMDICHYLSIPSLLTRVVFGKWVLWPELTKLYPVNWLTAVMGRKTSPEESGAIFWVLAKKSSGR